MASAVQGVCKQGLMVHSRIVLFFLGLETRNKLGNWPQVLIITINRYCTMQGRHCPWFGLCMEAWMHTHIHTHTFCTNTWDGMGKLRCGAVPCPNEHDA